jgi:hypothetical protein
MPKCIVHLQKIKSKKQSRGHAFFVSFSVLSLFFVVALFSSSFLLFFLRLAPFCLGFYMHEEVDDVGIQSCVLLRFFFFFFFFFFSFAPLLFWSILPCLSLCAHRQHVMELLHLACYFWKLFFFFFFFFFFFIRFCKACSSERLLERSLRSQGKSGAIWRRVCVLVRRGAGR